MKFPRNPKGKPIIPSIPKEPTDEYIKGYCIKYGFDDELKGLMHYCKAFAKNFPELELSAQTLYDQALTLDKDIDLGLKKAVKEAVLRYRSRQSYVDNAKTSN